MRSEQWDRTKQILDEALRLAPNQRAAYLAAECGSDTQLRAEVESLIAAHEARAVGFWPMRRQPC